MKIDMQSEPRPLLVAMQWRSAQQHPHHINHPSASWRVSVSAICLPERILHLQLLLQWVMLCWLSAECWLMPGCWVVGEAAPPLVEHLSSHSCLV